MTKYDAINLHDHLDVLEEANAGQHKYYCPVCEGNDLSISPEDGRLFTCWSGGCNRLSILRALGLTSKQPTANKPQHEHKRMVTKMEKVKATTTTYTYQDLDGNDTVTVWRTDNEDGTKRIWNEYTSDSRDVTVYKWSWVERRLNRGDTLCWVEGEKCVEAMNQNGFIATTTLGGSNGLKRTTQWPDELKGANIVIIPDCDKPGRKYADAIRKRYPQAGIIHLPYPEGSGKDIADYLEAGGKLEGLEVERPAAVKPTAKRGLRSINRFDLDQALKWYYVIEQDMFCHPSNALAMIKPSAYRRRFGIEAANVVMDERMVSNIIFHPGKQETFLYRGAPVLNTHVPYRQGREGNATPMVEHWRRMFPDEAEVLFDFMAFTLQHPDVKIPWAPYICSPHKGTGKDLGLSPLAWAMGSECQERGLHEVTSVYNEYYLQAKLLRVNETFEMGGTRMRVAMQLRPIIAPGQPEVMVNVKSMKKVEGVNILNVFITTNEADSIRTDNDRRYFACFDPKPPQPPAYYEELSAWLESGGKQYFVHWLWQRDLSGFNPYKQPTPTKSLDAVKDASTGAIDEVIADLLGDYGVLSATNLVRAVSHQLEDTKSERLVKERALEAGYRIEKVQNVMLPRGRTCRTLVMCPERFPDVADAKAHYERISDQGEPFAKG